MNTAPEFLQPVLRETIRRFLEELPVIGFEEFLARATSFLRLSSILPRSGPARFHLPRALGVLPSILAHGRSGTGKTTFGYYLYLFVSKTLGEDVAYYPAAGLVYLDANPIIYSVEKHPVYWPLCNLSGKRPREKPLRVSPL